MPRVGRNPKTGVVVPHPWPIEYRVSLLASPCVWNSTPTLVEDYSIADRIRNPGLPLFQRLSLTDVLLRGSRLISSGFFRLIFSPFLNTCAPKMIFLCFFGIFHFVAASSFSLRGDMCRADAVNEVHPRNYRSTSALRFALKVPSCFSFVAC